ncbi:MAG TPA: hypothetical protein VEI05_02280 [Burkholderiaceae bacterium]|nr:hypothetical protein [Burkholderiaceae bacterium]
MSLQKERALPRRGPKPNIGACIVCEDVRMTVQAGMSNELWRWLMQQGWRELTYRPDRRHYREVPLTWVTRLIDAPAELWSQVLAAAVAKAAHRCHLADSRPVHSYVVRH